MSVFKGLTIDRKVLYLLSASLFAVLLFLLFLPNAIARYICTAFVIIMAITIHFLVSKRSILSINKREVLVIFTVVGLLYLTVYYVTGIFYGFTPNPYSPTVSTLFSHILPITAVIIATEITRRILLAQKDVIVNILMYFSGVAAEILMLSSSTGVNTFNQFMDLVGIVILPALGSNLLYNYTASKYGALPIVVYRLLKTLHVYLIPVATAVPESLLAFFELVLPLIVFAFIYALYESKGKKAIARPAWWKKLITVLCIILMISVVMLISCQFEYGIIVIGSESMTGELNKGDALVYQDYDQGDSINEGDVLIFDKDGTRTVHRVIKIEYVNGQKRYYTKGDANTVSDTGYIVDANIIGTAEFKIAYVGYPSIWVRSIFN